MMSRSPGRDSRCRRPGGQAREHRLAVKQRHHPEQASTKISSRQLLDDVGGMARAAKATTKSLGTARAGRPQAEHGRSDGSRVRTPCRS